MFELLTASFAADNFQLRDNWNAREKRLKTQYAVLRNLQSDDFLQAISLLVTQSRRRAALDDGTTTDKAPGISCKRKDILKLEVTDWQAWADRVEHGFGHAARFLHGQNIFKSRDLPYRTQLVPLAAIFTDLDNTGENAGARREIARWFWCGVLGETVRQRHRKPLCTRSAGGGRPGPRRGGGARHHRRIELPGRTPADVAHPQQLRVQGALCAADPRRRP